MTLLSAISTTANRYAAGEYNARIRESFSDTEEQEIVSIFNRFLGDIERILSEKSRMIQDRAGEDQMLDGEAAEILKKLRPLSSVHSGGNTGQIGSFGTGRASMIRQISTVVDEVLSGTNSLSSEISAVSMGLISGNVQSRVNTALFMGTFRDIAENVNSALDSVTVAVEELVRVTGSFAQNEFSSRSRPDLRLNGDWRRISTSLDSVGEQITTAFGTIGQQVMELSANSQEANATVLEVANNSEQVAKNSNVVSENMERSDAGVRQVLHAMEDLSVTVGDVSQKADSVSRLATESNSLAMEGSDFAKKAEEGMGVIIRSNSDVDQIIGEIQGDMKKIDEIVRLITEIASQTNLLALNAAIEAARAGELGRGFAVVAAEVKALALESRHSAEKITDMIGNLQKKSENATSAVSVATTAVNNGNVMISDMLRIFSKMVDSVQEISANIVQVASMNEEQAAAVEEITSSMHEVSAMLKDTAKEAVDSASAMNETSSSVNQLKDIVDHVASVTEEISASVAKYQV